MQIFFLPPFLIVGDMKEVFHNCGKPSSDNDLENIIESGLQSVEPHIFNKAGGIPSGPELKSSSSFKN